MTILQRQSNLCNPIECRVLMCLTRNQGLCNFHRRSCLITLFCISICHPITNDLCRQFFVDAQIQYIHIALFFRSRIIITRYQNSLQFHKLSSNFVLGRFRWIFIEDNGVVLCWCLHLMLSRGGTGPPPKTTMLSPKWEAIIGRHLLIWERRASDDEGSLLLSRRITRSRASRRAPMYNTMSWMGRMRTGGS